MPRLPPVEKLPLVARKNLRDNWESVKEEKEKKLSELLGESWTIDINPLALYPYGEDRGWARESPGDMIAAYVSGAESRLSSIIDRLGDDFKTELNDACTAHTLTMDMDEDELFNYCGCKVSEDGKLFILFRETCLGTNIDDALEQERLEKALNDAPTTKDKPMNYEARSSVSKEYTPSIGATQEKLNGILGKDVKLEPGFEAVFDKLKSSSGEGLRDDWDTQVGPFVRMYFEAFVGYLERENFGSDEMLKEGLLEAAEGSEVRFRVVGETKQTYNETVIEDGFVYLQTTPKYFGANIDDVSNNLMDLL